MSKKYRFGREALKIRFSRLRLLAHARSGDCKGVEQFLDDPFLVILVPHEGLSF
jgi:hypothetical protein